MPYQPQMNEDQARAAALARQQAQSASEKANKGYQSPIDSNINPTGGPGGLNSVDYQSGNQARHRAGLTYGDTYGVLSGTELGEYNGGANDIAGRLSGMGASFQGRSGPQIFDRYAPANRYAQGQSRDQSDQALGMLAGAANGNAPSAAATQMGMGIDSSLASQMGAANGVRGPNAALANRMSALQGQQAQMQGVDAGSNARAQEMAQARGSYGQADIGQRAQDLQLAGLDQKSALAQAAIESGQMTQNDRMQAQYDQLGLDAQSAQLQAQAQKYGADRGVNAADSAQTSQNIMSAIGAGAATLGSIALMVA